MIRERNVKGPLSTVEHNGKTYCVEYRRRYYEIATHFTWIEIELSSGNWTECRDAFQTGLGGTRLTAKVVRNAVKQELDRISFAKDHFVFVHIGGES